MSDTEPSVSTIEGSGLEHRTFSFRRPELRSGTSDASMSDTGWSRVEDRSRRCATPELRCPRPDRPVFETDGSVSDTEGLMSNTGFFEGEKRCFVCDFGALGRFWRFWVVGALGPLDDRRRRRAVLAAGGPRLAEVVRRTDEAPAAIARSPFLGGRLRADRRRTTRRLHLRARARIGAIGRRAVGGPACMR
jgi:hypothetical protein